MLSDRLIEIAEIAALINFTIQDDITGELTSEQQVNVKEDLLNLIHKLGILTGYDIDTRAEEVKSASKKI